MTDTPPPFGSRPATSLREPALPPNLMPALLRWIEAVPQPLHGVLIGGLAMCFYTRPRMTIDVDILVPGEYALPNEAAGFLRMTAGVYVDNTSQVEINVCTPSAIGISDSLARQVADSARSIDGVVMASAAGLIALKLHGARVPKRRMQESADIQCLLEYHEVDWTGWELPPAHRAMLADIAETAESWIEDPTHPRFGQKSRPGRKKGR